MRTRQLIGLNAIPTIVDSQCSRRRMRNCVAGLKVMLGACLVVFALLGSVTPLSRFTDITSSSGVNYRNQASKTSQKYLIESMVGGVALFDFDGDGFLDIYFVNGAALSDPMAEGQTPSKTDPRFWNRLYRNNGDGSFSDVTEKAGVQGSYYGMGAAVADYDNDGRPDLYVTNLGRNLLYHNQGDGTFREVSQTAGVAGSGWSTGATFVDFDRDGHLDLFVARYLEWGFSNNQWCGGKEPGLRAYCHPNQFKAVTHILYRNKGDGTFEDVSKAAGFVSAPGKGLGVAINDFDRDGWPDILVANDSHPQQLFRNKGNGTFEEVALPLGLAYDDDGQTFAGMGIDFADYDNDGWPDVFINALANQRYALFKNNKGNFEYESGRSGVASITKLHSGWGARFADFDNDGWKDIFVAQGHVMDNIEMTQPSTRYREPLLLLRNVQGKFHDVSAQSGEPFLPPRAARGAAIGDLNNDGSPDIVVQCNDGAALVLRNEVSKTQSWLMVNTVGTASNRDGIGAVVRIVTASGREQHGFVSTSSSYLSASDKRLHFGLGSDNNVKLLEVRWPSGTIQKLENVKANQILTVREPAVSKKPAAR